MRASGSSDTRSRARRTASVLAAVLAALAWWTYLRPVTLGGSTTYVFVQGSSMQPTYHTGDLVIVRRVAQYDRGDVAAFRVPEGRPGAGQVIIHRVVDDAPGGYRLQGDNLLSEDPWRPSEAEMVGKPVVVVPRLGLLLAWLYHPVRLGAVSAAVATLVVLAGSTGGGYQPKHSRPRTLKEALADLVPVRHRPAPRHAA